MSTFEKVMFFILIILFLSNIVLISIFLHTFIKYMKNSKEGKKEYYELLNRKLEKESIVFLGDSLTEFYRTDEFLREFNIYNRGIAGDTTDGVLDRLESNVIVMKPKKIFLQIGTNDLSEKKKPSYIIDNIKKIVFILKEKLPETKLYLISLYPINKKATAVSKIIVGRRKQPDIEKINSALVRFAEEQNITYIDIFSHLLDDDNRLKKEFTVEGLHISLDGYSFITNLLYKYVEE